MSEKIFIGDSKERVALDLAILIARPSVSEKNRDEKDWLALYRKCLLTVVGHPPETSPRSE